MDVSEIIENEWYVVRHSGETPEIAFHSAIYYLTRAKDGPRLSLTGDQLVDLQGAAVDQFYEIITRDITPKNIDSSSYRGIERSIVNYQRYLKFCQRQSLTNTLESAVGKQLIVFLALPALEQNATMLRQCLNCSLEEIIAFSLQLKTDCRTRLDELREVVDGCFSSG